MAGETKREPLDEQVRRELAPNAKGLGLLERVEENETFGATCDMANTVAVTRLGFNDHGRTHVRIAAKNALAILRLLSEAGVRPNFVAERHGTYEDAQAIVLLGALFHDLGNAIQRERHEEHGVYLAGGVLDEVLPEFYPAAAARSKVKLSVLGCIFETRDGVHCTSVEAGAVSVGDGADCENGRARIPYKLFRKPDIHSVSALAIKAVAIGAGKLKPVRITVDMSNPSGLFQVNEVLGKKVAASGIADHIEVSPRINGKEIGDVDMARL